jgi:hypothetical protein
LELASKILEARFLPMIVTLLRSTNLPSPDETVVTSQRMMSEDTAEQCDALRKLDQLSQFSAPWAVKFCHFLKFVRDHPEFANTIGLYVIDGRTILVNVTIFAAFTHRKPNSVRRSLRTHHLPRRRRVPPDLNIPLENRRHWNIHEARDDLFGSNWESALRYARHPGRANDPPNDATSDVFSCDSIDGLVFDESDE